MEVITQIGLVICGAALIGCFWGYHCNELTYAQRQHLIETIFDNDRWRVLMRHYEEVSYDRHMWVLFFARDARKLYSTELRRVAGWVND